MELPSLNLTHKSNTTNPTTMSSLIMFSLLIYLYLSKGLTESVETQSIVTATLGENAQIRCRLLRSKDVLQVTWHKVSRGGTENVATYSKRFGPKVNAPFVRNMLFEEVGLQDSSIVIRRVRWEDESCYRCLFNAFPEGAIAGRTCLRVYELYKPSIQVSESPTASENMTERYPNGHQGSDGGQQRSTMSCCATGHPAPTLLWDVSAHVSLSNATVTRVTNGNGTVTVTSTLTVMARPDLHGNVSVRCVASLFSQTVAKEVVTVITFKDPAFIGDNKDAVRALGWVAIGAVFGVVSITCGIILLVVRSYISFKSSSHLQNPIDAEQRGTGTPSGTPVREPLKSPTVGRVTPHSGIRGQSSEEREGLTSAVHRTPSSEIKGQRGSTSAVYRTPFSERKGQRLEEKRVHKNSSHEIFLLNGSTSRGNGHSDAVPLEG